MSSACWWQEAKQFLTYCRIRIEDAVVKYGPVRSDPRNRSKEAIDENFDIYNYIGPIMLAKHPELKNNEVRLKCVRLNFRLYLKLRELEKIENELEAKKRGNVESRGT